MKCNNVHISFRFQAVKQETIVMDLNPCILHFEPNPIHGESYSFFVLFCIYKAENTALYETTV